MRTEVPCTVEEPHEWIVRVFQLLHVGKETARLDRIQEVAAAPAPAISRTSPPQAVGRRCC